MKDNILKCYVSTPYSLGHPLKVALPANDEVYGLQPRNLTLYE